MHNSGFWFLVFNDATQLALQLHEERIQVVLRRFVIIVVVMPPHIFPTVSLC